MGFQQKILHPCELPDIPATGDFRFTCPDCGSTWSAWRSPSQETVERYGFLRLRSRVIVSTPLALWFSDHRTFEWREV